MGDPSSVAEFMRALWVVFGGVTGACLGSFANVVVSRVPRGLSVVHPPSRCPQCEKPIRPWENIPIVSWVMLGGKARCCGVRISPRYVWVETLGLVLGAGVVLVYGAGPAAIMFGLTLLMTVCAGLIDAEHWILPEGLTLGLLPVGVLLGPLVQRWGGLEWADAVREALVKSASGAALGFLLLWTMRKSATWLARRLGRIGPDEDAQGEGDEHLLAGAGAVLGPWGVWVTLMLAAAQGSVWGLYQVLQRRLSGAPAAPAPVPDPTGEDDDWTPPPGALTFGPFLALGVVEAVFLLPWYPPPDLILLKDALMDLFTGAPAP